jgi:leader peptidase (prepilin peptidase)/N-methyltransferase
MKTATVVVVAMLVGAWCVGVAACYVGLLRRAMRQPGGNHDFGALFARALAGGCGRLLRAPGRAMGPGKAVQNNGARAWPRFRAQAPRLACLARLACPLLYAALAGMLFHAHVPWPVFAGYCAAMAILMVLAIVDAGTCLLPDALTYPLLWLGLALAWWGGPISLHNAVAGAVSGYLFPWLLAVVFHLVRRRQGMGHGDFKLLAALGAWLGVGPLPYVLLAACLSGILFACVVQRRVWPAGAYPFGPFLAAAGAAAMVAGLAAG